MKSLNQENKLLEAKEIKKYFPIKQGFFSKSEGVLKAVDGISFTVNRAETLGLVGESGCGKTTTGRVLLRLLEATSGKAYFHTSEGQIYSIFDLDKSELRQLRRRIQIIFQDPFSSLNPRMSVYGIVSEPLKIHKLSKKSELQDKVNQLLETVGLNPQHAKRYPHEFSGGQRQRIGIARALAVQPELIIADEPVSALDVSIQAQVINLLEDLQAQFQLSFIFIAHDLSVVKHISHRVAVMYLGRIVEFASKQELYDNPLHPYTQALLSAVPIPDPTIKRHRIILKGDIPSPTNPPSGCPFHTRCHKVQQECSSTNQKLVDVGDNHLVACHVVTKV
ncbi:TPA: dipeptide ABC transporter ATP-binding protein [Candidatus Poribacteria bacterium]|nr:dipeptide ABC transporter ATP-binding protein [Candidatus Poribacteria bacterium]